MTQHDAGALAQHIPEPIRIGGSGEDGQQPQPPFVGRQRELEVLHAHLAAARNGRGSYVSIAGPAGSGKSRLVQQLATSTEHLGSSVLARCVPNDVPLSPWIQLIAASPTTATPTATGPDGTDPGAVVDALLESWAALHPPVLAVIDDVDLADHASIEVLRTLVPLVAEEPVLLVTTLRAPRAAGGPTPPALPLPASELLLPGLGTLDIVALLRQRHAQLDDAALAERAVHLLARTGGSPLALSTNLARAGPEGNVLPDAPTNGATGNVADTDLLLALGELDPASLEVLQLRSLAPTLSAQDLAAVAERPQPAVTATFAHLTDLGLLSQASGDRGTLAPNARVAELALRALSGSDRERLHERIARHLDADPTVPATVVAQHALQAGERLPAARRAEIGERAGREALSRGALTEADRFLAAAADAAGEDQHRRLRCLLARAEVAQRCGNLDATGELAEVAARLAGALGDADAIAEAAVRYAYPTEWRTGDPVAENLLTTAERANPSPAWLAQVLAVRAMVEMRLPLAGEQGNQWSWLTRADVGQPLADRAMAVAETSGDPTASLMALLAWRSTHRAPRYLDQRREVSGRAQQLAQRLHRFDLLVEAGLRGATDELEAGSRAGFEEGIALVRWAAERTQEPRLLWRAACLDAARGVLDGSLEVIAEHRDRARAIARATPLPGAEIADALFSLQLAMLSGADAQVAETVLGDHPALTHQLGQAGSALLAAVLGRHEEARGLLDQLVRPLDDETSVLLTACLAGRAAALIGASDHAQWLRTVLAPWRAHVAVDAECFWPAIPVATVTTQLHRLLGDEEAARADHQRAERSTQILRSPAIARLLDHPGQSGEVELTERQQRVLHGLADGRSNAQMAMSLGFSLATIRRETTAIYRALQVSNRAEAVNEGHRRHLI